MRSHTTSTSMFPRPTDTAQRQHSHPRLHWGNREPCEPDAGGGRARSADLGWRSGPLCSQRRRPSAGPGCSSGGRWANWGNSFWYLDAMGSKARNGYSAFCRQDFVGIDYGMLDCKTQAPLPDYYGGVLWSMLMGRSVMSVTGAAPLAGRTIRAYAHCAANSTTRAVTAAQHRRGGGGRRPPSQPRWQQRTAHRVASHWPGGHQRCPGCAEWENAEIFCRPRRRGGAAQSRWPHGSTGSWRR